MRSETGKVPFDRGRPDRKNITRGSRPLCGGRLNEKSRREWSWLYARTLKGFFCRAHLTDHVRTSEDTGLALTVASTYRDRERQTGPKALAEGQPVVPPRPWRRLGYLPIVACGMTTCMLSIPFILRPQFSWVEMSPLLLAGTAGLAVAVLCHASVVFSFREAVRFFFLSFFISLAAEYAGTRWGIPFGAYRYHDDLTPKILGNVPLFIPLSWFVLAYPALVVLRLFRIRPTGSLSPKLLILKTGLCALHLMCADLLLEPLATSVGAWAWEREGSYYGTPIGNFAGWLLVGVALYGSFFLLSNPATTKHNGNHFSLNATALALYAVLLTLALFAAIRRLGHGLPVLLSAALLAPYWFYGFILEARLRQGAARRHSARQMAIERLLEQGP